MQEDQQIDPQYWCKFEITNQITLQMQYVFLALMIVLGPILLYDFIKVYANFHEYYHWWTRHCLLFIWYALTLLKTLLGIFIYLFELSQQKDYTTSLRVQSGTFFFLDTTNTFFLHLLLMRVPLKWQKRTIYHIEITNSITINERKQLHVIFQYFKILDLYLKIRYVILLVNIANIFVLSFGGWIIIHIFNLIVILYLVIEAVYLILTYAVGWILFSKVRGYLNIQNGTMANLKKEYLILSGFCLIRVIYLITFFFVDLSDYEPNEICVDNDYFRGMQDKVQSRKRTLAIGSSLFITHYLMVIVILYIYWFRLKNDSVKQSLSNSKYTKIIN